MSKSRHDTLVGTRIREYEILDVIGKGGMGAVYKARHVLLQKIRAIKVIHTQYVEESAFVDRFIHEARMLTELNHPNVIHLYDFGTLEEQSFFFMVLEFLEGETVMDRIHRLGKIPVYDSLRIIRQAALGLHNAHQKGMIHRDVAPDNLFLVKDENGREITKVIDFGIAKPNLDATRQVTLANMFIGKPEYCSPEQCGLLEAGEMIDRRSDIYSLAVTLYFMLAGELPFASQSIQGYLYKHVNEDPKPVSTLLPQETITPELDRLILKALSKKREKRHSNLEEFINELDDSVPIAAPTIRITAPFPSSMLLPGQLFARRFVVDKKLGEGGMGAVYKAIDNIIGLPVALKVLNKSISLNQQMLERFKREVILARKVTHPNVCRIYDIGESDGTHYVSMEYLEGKSLAQMIKDQGPLSPDLGIGILRQVLLALNEAHQAGVIHRDLKPQNIMVDPKYKALIMDFGISLSKEMSRVTEAGVLVGTPFYMAPEQFEGKSIDQRTDIYSLGVIMFEVFTGRLPFIADSPMAIIFAHVKSPPPRPSELVSSIPSTLEKIILKALEKEPGNRYQNVSELIEALELVSEPEKGTKEFRSESLAHKYMAKHSYSKAIKYLTLLLRNNPDNLEWKKLLNLAVTEKAKRELKKVRSLIQKNQLAEAQQLIDRIVKENVQNTRIVSLVQKLDGLLQTRKEKELESHLQEAERLASEEQLDSASSHIAAASQLKPEDTRVSKVQKRIELLREEILGASVKPRLEEVRNLIQQAKWEQADRILNEVLSNQPGYLPAVELKEEIQHGWKRVNEEKAIVKSLEMAMQAWSKIDFEKAASHLRDLISSAAEQDFKTQLKRYLDLTEEMHRHFESKNFKKVPGMLQTLLIEDSQSWLTPYKKLIIQVEQESVRREQAESEFQSAIESGKKYFNEHKWKEAIEIWKKAQEIHPGDSSLTQWVQDTTQKLNTEQQILQQLSDRLAEGESILSGKRFDEVDRLLSNVRKIVEEYNLQNLLPRISDLDTRLKQAIELEAARIQQVKAELERIKASYQKTDLEQALSRVKQILKNDPELNEAKSLKLEIDNFIEQRRRKDSLFEQAFHRGQKFYEEKSWSEAIQVWQEALQANPDHESTKKLIEAAESKQREENRIKEQIQSNLSLCETHIRKKEFAEAQRLLDVCRDMITDEYHLEELSLKVNAAEQHLLAEKDNETAKQLAREKKLNSAKMLLRNGNPQEARSEAAALLKEFPEWNPALELREQAESAIRKKQAAGNKFKEFFDQGKLLFEQNRWEDAIVRWNEALQIQPEAVPVKACISSAEDCLRDESRAKNEISGRLAECRNAISRGDFANATIQLEDARKQLSSQARLDFEDEISALEAQISDELEQMNTIIKAPSVQQQTEKRSEMISIPEASVQDTIMSQNLPDMKFPGTLRSEDFQQETSSVQRAQPDMQPISQTVQLTDVIPSSTPVSTLESSKQFTRPKYIYLGTLIFAVVALLAGWMLYRNLSDSTGKKRESESGITASGTNTQKSPGTESIKDSSEAKKVEQVKRLIAEAAAFVSAKNYAAAITKYEEILAVDPANSEAKEGLSGAEQQLQLLKHQTEQQLLQQQEAERRQAEINQLKDAVEKNLSQGKLEAAENQLMQMLKLDSTNAYAKERLASVRNGIREEKQSAEKEARLRQLIASGKSDLSEKNFEQAAKTFNEVLKLDPSHSEARRLLSQAETEVQKPRFGTISIRTKPTQAEIIIDGDLVGKGLYPRSKIKVGKHEIIIRFPGYQQLNVLIDIKDNQPPYDKQYELKKLE